MSSRVKRGSSGRQILQRPTLTIRRVTAPHWTRSVLPFAPCPCRNSQRARAKRRRFWWYRRELPHFRRPPNNRRSYAIFLRACSLTCLPAQLVASSPPSFHLPTPASITLLFS